MGIQETTLASFIDLNFAVRPGVGAGGLRCVAVAVYMTKTSRSIPFQTRLPSFKSD
jgi:hypothetical protein